MKLLPFLTFASLSLWESRAEGPERATALRVVESTAGSNDPPRPLRGRPSRPREGEAKLLCPNGSKAARSLGGSETSVSEFPGRVVGIPTEPLSTLPEGSFLAFDPPRGRVKMREEIIQIQSTLSFRLDRVRVGGF